MGQGRLLKCLPVTLGITHFIKNYFAENHKDDPKISVVRWHIFYKRKGLWASSVLVDEIID
jgi:hypothetical protein